MKRMGRPAFWVICGTLVLVASVVIVAFFVSLCRRAGRRFARTRRNLTTTHVVTVSGAVQHPFPYKTAPTPPPPYHLVYPQSPYNDAWSAVPQRALSPSNLGPTAPPEEAHIGQQKYYPNVQPPYT